MNDVKIFYGHWICFYIINTCISNIGTEQQEILSSLLKRQHVWYSKNNIGTSEWKSWRIYIIKRILYALLNPFKYSYVDVY